MKQDSKVKVYQDIYAKLKEDSQVHNQGYPKQKNNYDFFFDINEVHVEFSLNAKADLLRLKAERAFPAGVPEETINEYCGKAANDPLIRSVHYDNKAIFQLSVVLTGITDQAAMDMVTGKTLYFVEFIKNNLSGGEGKEWEEVGGPGTYVPDPDTLDAKGEHPGEEDMTQGQDATGTETGEQPQYSGEEEETQGQDTGNAPGPDAKGPGNTAREVPGPEACELPMCTPERVRAEDGRDKGKGNKMQGQGDAPTQEEDGAAVYSPEVAKEMRKLYADMDKAFESRKKQMDYRQDTLDKKEGILNEKDKEIHSRMEMLKKKEDQWDIKESEYAAKVRNLDLREQTLNAREGDVEKRSEFVKSLEEKTSQKYVDVLKKQIAELEKENGRMKEHIKNDPSAKENEGLRMQVEKLNETLVREREISRQAKGQAESEKADALRKVAELESSYEDLNGKFTKLQEEAAIYRTPSVNEVMGEMEKAGYSAHIEGNQVIAEKNGVNLKVIPELHVIRADKPAKRGVLHKQRDGLWSSESEFFCALERMIVAVVSYKNDYVKACNDTVEKLGTIS